MKRLEQTKQQTFDTNTIIFLLHNIKIVEIAEDDPNDISETGTMRMQKTLLS